MRGIPLKITAPHGDSSGLHAVCVMTEGEQGGRSVVEPIGSLPGTVYTPWTWEREGEVSGVRLTAPEVDLNIAPSAIAVHVVGIGTHPRREPSMGTDMPDSPPLRLYGTTVGF